MPKKRILISIDEELHEKAKELKINISGTCNSAIHREVFGFDNIEHRIVVLNQEEDRIHKKLLQTREQCKKRLNAVRLDYLQQRRQVKDHFQAETDTLNMRLAQIEEEVKGHITQLEFEREEQLKAGLLRKLNNVIINQGFNFDRTWEASHDLREQLEKLGLDVNSRPGLIQHILRLKSIHGV
jgi:hypothetical protein